MLNDVMRWVSSVGQRTLAVSETFGRANLMLVGALVGRPQPIRHFRSSFASYTALVCSHWRSLSSLGSLLAWCSAYKAM